MITREEAEQGNEELQESIKEILWRMFRADRGPQHPVKAIAPELGIAPDTLNKYIRGSLPFPAYHIPALYNATHDDELLAWIINRCEGVTLSGLSEHRVPDGDVTDNVDEVMLACFSLFEAKVDTFRDGEITTAECDQLAALGIRIRSAIDGFIDEIKQRREREITIR